jgi:tetratricopeptide (TPR) repeat protein
MSANVGSELSGALLRARELMRQGALDAADEIVGGALAHSPRDADALHLRGAIANLRREHAAAIVALIDAVAVRPALTPAWLELANAYARLDQCDAAAGAYREVLAREPSWPDAHFNLGLMRKRLGDRMGAARSFLGAWTRDPMLFNAAGYCVATLAECVREGDRAVARPAMTLDAKPVTVSVVICSIDDEKHDRAVALYRRLFASAGTQANAHVRHEIISIRNARSLAEAYNWAVRKSVADVIVLSHDDVDVLAEDFAARLFHHLRSFDAVGVVGSTRADGPAVGWSGHPHLRGWITHHSPRQGEWQVDLLDHRELAADIAVLDGVFLAVRREVLQAVPFDSVTFDGFHVGDIDWSLRASQAGFRLGVAADLGLVHASRGNYDATWQRYADRFSAKHSLGAAAPAPSFFFGAKLDGPGEVRAFFDLLRGLGAD